jgi:hypothetical protein
LAALQTTVIVKGVDRDSKGYSADKAYPLRQEEIVKYTKPVTDKFIFELRVGLQKVLVGFCVSHLTCCAV